MAELLRMIVLCIAATSASAVSGAPCRVEVKVFNAHGDTPRFKIVRLSPIGKNLDALTMPGIVKVDSKNSGILVFAQDKNALAGRFDILLEILGSPVPKQKVAIRITSCPQRVSIVAGPPLLGPIDMAGESVRGKITGCSIIGDWWVKVTPMFGTEVTEAVVEGTVNSDGTFDASGFMGGQRALITIGKGKDPVKVIGADIYNGKFNDLGLLDLSSVCPR